MTELTSAERLQPSLLDRLIDDEPQRRDEPLDARVFNRQRLRAAVLRDLSWLFNATNAGRRIDAARFPAAHASVLNYGLPCLSGNFASSVDMVTLEQSIREAIRQFEPRIAPDSIEIEPVLDKPVLELHNQIALVIRGLLWAQPAPLEIALHTQIDLEEGGITVTELRR